MYDLIVDVDTAGRTDAPSAWGTARMVGFKAEDGCEVGSLVGGLRPAEQGRQCARQYGRIPCHYPIIRQTVTAGRTNCLRSGPPTWRLIAAFGFPYRNVGGEQRLPIV
jgi:hypothetical protein